jgi:hypothetical protein
LGALNEEASDYGNAIKYRVALRNLDPWNADNLLQLERDYLKIRDKNAATLVRNAITRMAPGTLDAAEAQLAIKG